eukprot:6275084-Prymnesium_polylepis.1
MLDTEIAQAAGTTRCPRQRLVVAQELRCRGRISVQTFDVAASFGLQELNSVDGQPIIRIQSRTDVDALSGSHARNREVGNTRAEKLVGGRHEIPMFIGPAHHNFQIGVATLKFFQLLDDHVRQSLVHVYQPNEPLRGLRSKGPNVDCHKQFESSPDEVGQAALIEAESD